MSPMLKYGSGRLGLFVLIALPVIFFVPDSVNFFLKLLLAFVVSAALGFVLLRPWRDQAAEELSQRAVRRVQRKERLRAALAGEEEQPTESGQVRDAGDRQPHE